MHFARLVRIATFVIFGAATLLAVNLCAGFTLTPFCFAAQEDSVIATLDNVSIMKSEVDRLVLEYKRKTRKKIVTDEEKEKLLNNLIRRHLILQQESVQALKNDKDIIAMVRKYEEDVIIARFLKDQVGRKLKITEDELKKYYKENRHRFSLPQKVKARHILLRTQEEAEKVMLKLRNDQTFGQLARECSIDLPMALEGGSMGTIEKGRTLPVLEKALFTLDVGEVSDIVETKFGYHILTVDKVIPAGGKSFEEVKDEIKKIVMQQKEAKAFSEMAERLERQADIKVFTDRLRETVQ